MNGIYILANDYVYHQLVALLNSIEVNIGKEMPVCIIPYDDRLDQVKAEIARRPQATLFENQDSIKRWEAFATQAWKVHHRAQKTWRDRELPEVYRLAMHRKLCCFDGLFDKFIYFDADTLAMGSAEPVYQLLDRYSWVTHDYQYCSDIKYIFDASQENLAHVFSSEKLKSHLFCAGWFASRKNVFNAETLARLLSYLQAGEADLMALWGPDQSLLNYMVLRSEISYYNFAFHGGGTGSHWSSSFDEINHLLYDKGRQLTYIHYMSIASSQFNQLCEGMAVDIPYKNLFLHYRYLMHPDERPKIFKPAKLASSSSGKLRAIADKIIQFTQKKIGSLYDKIRQSKAV
ncbi:Npun_R2821/Npun_R2822 family protein [Myxacorys almedinensis]|nr:Npun_R2821/Npun_R2822 family protein [Myxacorys almedinensis]